LTGTLVDLHTHTAASDGSDSPAELVAAAATAGVEVLAVTDHDTVAAVAEARLAGQRLGVEVLAGAELTAEVGGRVVQCCCTARACWRPTWPRTSRPCGVAVGSAT
jgi:predicted metal-dependent phosphoesterase TrpH